MCIELIPLYPLSHSAVSYDAIRPLLVINECHFHYDFHYEIRRVDYYSAHTLRDDA